MTSKTSQGRNFRVRWQYSGKNRSKTMCFVDELMGDNEVLLLSSVSIRKHSKDQWVKEVARKRSMKRALEAANLTKEERKTIWESYFNRIPAKEEK